MITYSKQNIDDTDIKTILKVLKSDFLTQGPSITKFEKALADYCGAKYAVAVANGTAALHLSCLALDLKQNDYHWTSAVSFAASANCGIYCGSCPDFIDISLDDFNLDINKLETKLKNAKTKNKLPKIIIPVHFAGYPCEMKNIDYLSKKYGFKIIEDACHALGAEYKINNNWHKIGDCRCSDITCFSFHPVKSITTGEGGAILTNDKKIYEKLLLLRSHGITKNISNFVWQNDWSLAAKKKVVSKFRNSKNNTLQNLPMPLECYYEMQALGFNYRITDFQCALGLSQLSRIDKFLKKRRQIADAYKNKLNHLLVFQKIDKLKYKSANHLVVILSQYRNLLFDYLKKNNILCQIHYIPIYRQPYYQSKYHFKPSDFPNAEKYFEQCLSIPCYYDLKKEELNFAIEKLKEFYAQTRIN
ncbi:MAG TPA: UDP-4-amino-4,6-dideoxy-N-acetyl-beta-L-altrosamine transaminase [bacterium]|nr:UDP-4-amino-4,6-dideoxy-N-acetyl-beta-L-altrosamine transaminase [bacterium]HPP87687.1 UDP-4-amino-4,6-dideoxy-N-acetyl-beta-L-altrosamine transaminase [bacterium]